MIDGMLIVWYRDGSCSRCEPDGLDALERAMEKFVGTGTAMFSGDDQRDSIVRLRALGAGPDSRVNLLASSVANWDYSTRASRAAATRVSAALAAEEKAAQTAATDRAAAGDGRTAGVADG